MSKKVLVTGGAGYIGSHCVIELINDGYDVLIADNWANAKKECIKQIETLVGRPIETVDLDVCDKDALNELFNKNKFYAVLHLAGLKAIGDSVASPLDFYKTNVYGTLNVLECMKEHDVKNLVFSSSATVYGFPQYLPLDEKHPTIGDQIASPYGKTKYVVEHMLKDLYQSDKSWNIVVLRYFNPVGSHESGLIGEDPIGTPSNLMPFLSQVAVGRLPELHVFGNDYKTPDGTAIRDYIHITDLAKGHSAAMKKLASKPGLKFYNLGTSKRYSVLEIIQAFERASGKTIPYKFVPRREGDVDRMYANDTLAEEELGWKATKTLDDICKDLWNWVSKHPQGFSS